MLRILNWLNKLPVSKKFQADVVWNVLSLIFLGASGVILNLLVARFYGAGTLGFFNKVYAIYILASQFAVGSVHLSVQKYIAHQHKSKERDRIISSGLLATTFFALITILLIFLSRNLWAWFLKDSTISLSIIYFLPGLFCFALNKTLLAFFNGLREMKIFAFFQTARYVFLVSFAVIAIVYKAPQDLLPAVFSASEITLLILLFLYSLRFFNFIAIKKWNGWLKKHYIFGIHSLLGNVLADVNTRVDVLILGYYLSDKQVGIYSFAAILAEGFSQVLVVLKTNINPILARLIAAHKTRELELTVRQGIKLTYKFAFVLGIVAVILYPLLVKIFLPHSDFMTSFPVFVILMSGIVLSSGYQPFQMLLAQAGYPRLYTRLITIVFVANAILNFTLIPVLGIYGSAIATAASFIISAIFLKLLTRASVKIKI